MPLQIHRITGVKSVPILLFGWLIFSQAKHKFHLLKNGYFYYMEMDIKTEEIRQINFGDNNQFSYTRKQVEIKNILGAAVAVLDEYSISDSAGVNYKLYKTKDGNWYDLPDANTGIAKDILLALKLKIDNQ